MCVCVCALLVKIIECLRGCTVQHVEPVLLRELRHPRNDYYLYCTVHVFTLHCI